MNSIFHEPHDKFLLAGQAACLARPAQFPRFILALERGIPLKIGGVNLLSFCGRNPLKSSGSAGGITEQLLALGCLEDVEAGNGQGRAGCGRQGFWRWLMLSKVKSAFWRSRWAEENNDNIFHCFIFEGSGSSPRMVRGAGAGEASVLALLHPVLPSSLPFFQGLIHFLPRWRMRNLALTSSSCCRFSYNGPNF